MPIKNLTDRNSLRPRLARLGKLRKGGEKKGNKPGPDLDHFRPDLDDAEVQSAFRDVYGNTPRFVNIVLFYETLEDNFSTWIECWDASGLVFRSDGEHWVIWREGDTYKRGKKPHVDMEGQDIVGRLEFLVPELIQQGYVGTVTLETHSNHDLRNIGSVLLAAEQERGTLRGAEFVLRRVEEEISVPGWGDRAGKRSKAKKWLVKVEPPRQLFRAVLEGRPASRPALEARVDTSTGEIVEVEGEIMDGDAEDDDGLVEMVASQLGATVRNPADTVTPQGRRLGDLGYDELMNIIDFLHGKDRLKTVAGADYQIGRLYDDAHLVIEQKLSREEPITPMPDEIAAIRDFFGDRADVQAIKGLLDKWDDIPF